MKGKGEYMKLLRIDDEKGEFLNERGDFQSVESLTKDDLLRIVKMVYAKNENDFDLYVEGKIKNKAQDIIYKNISSKLDEIKTNRNQINVEVEEKFKDAFTKYR
jgi:hypothetical protein